jgi:glyoxylase-like metal-dependent hydrolase (beta-lactamase superfamily II)
MEGRVRPDCREIAAGVYCLEAGKGFMRSNVYFVRSASSWVLVDTGTANCGGMIRQAADSLFGIHARPAAILLTHDHPDHAGSVLELTRVWDCPVYLHPDELPLASGGLSTFQKYASPMDRWLVLPLLRAMPRRRVDAMISRSSLKNAVQAFDPGAGVPFLPDWKCIPAPGHTPGAVALFRPRDRVLITGDSLLTVDLNSPFGYLRWVLRLSKQRVCGPPWLSTWDWQAAKRSVVALSGLEPSALASGHGVPMSGGLLAGQLRALGRRFSEKPAVSHG